MSNSFYSKVFKWLFIGLLISFGSGYAIMYSPPILNLLFNGIVYIIVFILQIGLCIYLSARINSICIVDYCNFIWNICIVWQSN